MKETLTILLKTYIIVVTNKGGRIMKTKGETNKEKYVKMRKSKSGVTLVALIITIIILLILAGVSIATLTESGLFNKAKLAEQKTENEQIKEETTLGDYENKIGEYINSTRITEDEINKICSALNDIGIETDKDETLESLVEKIRHIKNNNITKLNIDGIGVQYSNVYYFYITDYNNYQNLTMDNISIQFNTIPFRNTQKSDLCGFLKYSYSYNPDNGCITVTLDGSGNHESWDYPKPSATITIIE